MAAGAEATFVGRAGDDALGRAAVAGLQAAGVHADVEIDHTLPTGTCIVLVDPTGERTMIPSAGANASAAPPAALPAHADWLYLSGYTLLGDTSRPRGLAVLDRARALGWPIAVDAASAAPLARVGAAAFLDWLGSDVLVLANADEAHVLTGLSDAPAAAQAIAQRCGRAVVKRGAAGAAWSDGTSVQSVPAVAAHLVDSTGAGDAFAAGFLACAGDIAESLAAGARLAAAAVARVGGRPIGIG